CIAIGFDSSQSSATWRLPVRCLSLNRGAWTSWSNFLLLSESAPRRPAPLPLRCTIPRRTYGLSFISPLLWDDSIPQSSRRNRGSRLHLNNGDDRHRSYAKPAIDVSCAIGKTQTAAHSIWQSISCGARRGSGASLPRRSPVTRVLVRPTGSKKYLARSDPST